MKPFKFYLMAGLFLVFVLPASSQSSLKMSPWLAQKASESLNAHKAGKANNAPSRGYPHKNYVLALVKTTDGENTLRQEGCAIVCNLGAAYAAFVPTDRLAALCAYPSILRMEANELPRPQLDHTVTVTRTDDVWQGIQSGLPQAFTGKGVITAIADGGFDFTHPAFLDDEGHSRFTWFWDFGKSENSQLGTIYDNSADILAAQHSSDAKEFYHATHVMGILAGRGLGDGRYRGIAYDAELMGVKIITEDEEKASDDIRSYIRSQVELGNLPDAYLKVSLSDVHLLLQIKAIFDRADAVGKPCVVNLSIGHSIAYDNLSPLTDEIFNSMLGPGHIIVNSSGNEGQSCVYAKKEAGETYFNHVVLWKDYSSLTLRCAEDAPDFNITFNFGNKTATLKEDDPIKMNSADVDSAMEEGQEWLADSVQNNIAKMVGRTEYQLVRMKRVDSEPGTRCYVLEADMCDMAKVIAKAFGAASRFTIEGTGEVEMMGRPNNFEFSTEYSNEENPGGQPYTITYPGTNARIVTVGATNNRQSFTNIEGSDTTHIHVFNHGEGHLASFSSCGPTIGGLIKPDVTAPGLNIIAPLNSYFEHMKVLGNYIEAEKVVGGMKVASVSNADGREYSVVANSGTSMSAPVVAGIIALWLEANPQLTPEDVLRVISLTSHQPDDAPSADKNNIYGYGMIDAYAGLLNILGIPDHIAGISTSQPRALTIRPDGNNSIALQFTTAPKRSFNISVYTTSGQLVHQQNVSSTSDCNCKISIGKELNGVHVVQITSSEEGVTGSELIRFGH